MTTTARPGVTHHDRCWTYHLDCANAEITRLRNRLAAVSALCDQIDNELDAVTDGLGVDTSTRVTHRFRAAMGDPS
jgi:hypothetical protein